MPSGTGSPLQTCCSWPAEPLPNTVGGGSLAQVCTYLVVATPVKQPAAKPLTRSLSLIEGSFSARKVVRQAPWLAGLHRVADGALVGLGVSMLALSALTLHWQNQWGRSYRDLETTQVLEHRLQESSAVLEPHHLGAVRRPGLLVPTSSSQLLHVAPPARPASAVLAAVTGQGLNWGQVAPGY